ncbi:hypothetical protein, partial [Micromonospora sp. NPDC049679]|uniref:hypothetical protein n=1 Tax=Micromonospora sp. NPDC049679 TaxID=3155920 RepID=UPI0033C3DC9E
MTHPYRPPHATPLQPRPRRKKLTWLWIVIAAGTLTLIGVGVRLTGGAAPGDSETDASGAAAAGAASAPAAAAGNAGKQDRDGWDACRRLRDLGATTFDQTINRTVGEHARKSTNQEIATRGKNLVDTTQKAAGQDPIDANLATCSRSLSIGAPRSRSCMPRPRSPWRSRSPRRS